MSDSHDSNSPPPPSSPSPERRKNPKRPQEFLGFRRRVLRIASWTTGISLGTAVFLVGALLIAAAIVVRTESFQSAVRDRVLKIAREEFDTTLTFASTEVDFFSFHPSLSFTKVKLHHPETKVDIDLNRLKISLSLLVSLPLLFAKQLHIDSVEIEGLSTELKSLRSLDRLISRLRPKHDYLPSVFQTTLQHAVLKNVALQLDLKPDSFLRESLSGEINLEEAQVDFLAASIDVSGTIGLKNIRYGDFQAITGRIELQDSSHNAKRSVFSTLRFTTGQSRIELSGEIRNWSDPQLRLQGDARFSVADFEENSPLQGDVNTKFQLRGLLSNMEGDGTATLRSTKLRSQPWINFDASWKLQNGTANIEAKQVESDQSPGQERVTLSASLPLKRAETFRVALNLSNAPIKNYWGLVAPEFQVWQGTMNGRVTYEANRSTPALGVAQLDLQFQNFDIRSYPTQRSILLTPTGVLKATIQMVEKQKAALNLLLDLGALRAEAKGTASKSGLLLDGNFVSRGLVGHLVNRKIEIEGRSDLRVEGPWSKIQITGNPQFSSLTLEGHKLTNVKGTIVYVDRKLTGVPLETDQLSVYGGIQFISGRDDEFAPIRFVIRDSEPAFIFSLIGIHSELIDTIKGRLEGKGELRGPLRRPIGSGTVAIRDWFFYRMTAKGLVARGKWATAGHDFFFDQVALRFHDDDEVVNGEMAFDGDGLVALSFDSGRLRWGHLQNVFGWTLPLQAETSFGFDFQRDVPSLEIKGTLKKTFLSGIEQPDSSGRLLWDGSDGVMTANLFGGAFRIDGHGTEKNDMRDSKWDISARDFSVANFSRALSTARLDWMLSGEGAIKVRQKLEKKSLIETLFQTRAALEGNFSVKASSLSRSGAVLHRFDPFEIKMEPLGNDSTRWVLPHMTVSSDRGGFQASGFFENTHSFSLGMNGLLDLRVWTAFYPSLARSEGWLNVDGQLKPDGFFGSLNVKEAVVNFQNSPFFVRNGEASLESRGSKMTLKKIRGEFREGILEGEGAAQIESGHVKDGDLHIRLKDSLFQPQQGFSFKVSGPLDIAIRNEKGSLTGELILREGLYRRRMDLKADLFKWTQSTRIQTGWDEEEKNPWENFAVNMKVRSQEPMIFRNNLVDGSANINLKATGTLGQPRLQGAVDIVKGQFYYVNRQFQVRSGSVQFSDPTSNIPLFDVRAETEISDYRVFLQIKGSGDNQKVTYSSEPPLNEKQILQLVLSGVPPQDPNENAGSSGASGNPGANAAYDPTRNLSWSGITFVTGQFQDRIERGLYSNLGIRRFGLSPAFSDSTHSTELQLTVGTDLIRNRLEVNYSNMLSTRGGHKVELELKMNRIVSLIGSWRNVEGSSQQDFGGDVRFRFEIE